MTYNVHRCIGADPRADSRRAAALIAECQPDIVALQELDVGRHRTGCIDQAHAGERPDQTVWGRPSGIAVARDGALLVSDDANGTIFRITHGSSSR
jgi:endonuclease/exonuclease/phosphatase family metal-dependent hydrolase